MSTFHDELAAICSEEAIRADQASDRRLPYADMITDLAAALGRTIGFATGGDAACIDRVLFTATRNVAKEAKTTAARLNLARTTPEGRA
ncbi:hypothetical protein [Pleomorphomonas sp. PLEO]|uniref:hypothetical protein n=1 Tax=Pleomorphomonas sp. PLEO TaxID=3239306 RepID=UPI00351E17F2